MSNLRLNPTRLADAIATLDNCFNVEAKRALEDRAAIVKSMPESAYKEELIRCERTNEQNYNSVLPSVRTLIANISEIKSVAEALAKRDLETTKSREAQAQSEEIDAVSALRPY